MSCSFLFKKKLKIAPNSFFIYSLLFSFFISYLFFWIYFFSNSLGKNFAYITFVLGLVGYFSLFQKKNFKILKSVFFNLILLFLVYFFYIFIYETYSIPIENRFTWQLPDDNTLPLKLAYCNFNSEEIKKCFKGDGFWISSDRPPLFSGLFLSILKLKFNKIFINEELFQFYQKLGTIFQLTWINAVYFFINSFYSKKFSKYFLLSMIFSGTILLNTLFTWPKIITLVPFLFSLKILLKTNQTYQEKLLAYGSLALANLFHGGILFTILGIIFLEFYKLIFNRNKLLELKKISFGLILFYIISAPWSLYQKYYDSKGDHLLKMRIAGQRNLDDQVLYPNHLLIREEQSFKEALFEAYSVVPLENIMESKLSNMITFFKISFPTKFNLVELASFFKINQFFYSFMSLGFLTIGILFFIKNLIFQKQKKLIYSMFIIFFISNLIWIFAMFEPNATVIHQGSYANLFFLFFFSCFGLKDFKYLKWIVLFLNFLIFCIWILPFDQNYFSNWRTLPLMISIICLVLILIYFNIKINFLKLLHFQKSNF